MQRGAYVKVKFDQKTKDSLLKLFLRSIPFFSAGPELFDVMRNIQSSQTAFDQQVTEAVNALQNTSALVATLQQGVTDRMAKLEELQKEHERYSQLAQIEAKQAEALINQVKDALGEEQTKERWIALAMHLGVGILFFVVGVLASDPFKAWCARLLSKLPH
jgi:DNA repair exonuclease SbcCD ATPase subunit